MALPVFQRTVVDEQGNIIPNAQVEVRLTNTGSLATIYSDKSQTLPLSNPFNADSNGLARFYALPQVYNVSATGGTGSIEWMDVHLIDSADITTIGQNFTAVEAVATNITDVGTVATDIANVNTAAINIQAIIDAQQAATDADNSATAASGSAYDAATSAASVDANNIIHTPGSGLSNQAGTVYSLNIGQLLARDYFSKTVKNKPLFSKTGNFSVSTNQVFYAEVGGLILTIASSTVVSMPSATVGTDYAIWLKTDGTLQATDNHTTPPVVGSRKIGGFHYAPGSNATAQSGGNTTPQINEYSFWDLKWRPTCADPRGMTCVAGTFWADIYFLNTNPDINGTSSFGKTIADGSSPPIIPAALNGNGSTTYGSLTWFEAMSIAAVYGKSAFTQPEFMAATFGVTEATSRGTNPVSTGLDAPRTSRWGIMQATGNLYTWGQDRGGAYNTAGWNANTEGFGSEYNAPNASLLGANWRNYFLAGSRFSYWGVSASFSDVDIGLRLRCDHLQLD